MHFIAVNRYAEPFLIALDNQALAIHLSNHVERLYRFAVQCQFFHVCRHVLLDRSLHLFLDLEEPVRGAKSFQTLVRTVVIVVLHPVREPLLRFVKGLELRA